LPLVDDDLVIKITWVKDPIAILHIQNDSLPITVLSEHLVGDKNRMPWHDFLGHKRG
jgi:hypothetical protein